ncbi:hypothetical protein [Clostridium sp. YIM B02551]|uniref:hypothetical protein n=1 Tax=Clostridium sp. YIM B02551 TaxID=2910679 RepID=UPI001EEB6104|nr:hypothetical protein [Clostridium sp. YIM B02551]
MKVVFFYCATKDRKKELLKKCLYRTASITAGIMVTYCVLPTPLSYTVAYADELEKGVSGITSIGYSVWKVLKTISMFVLACFTVRDILKELNDSSIKDISKILVKYLSAWAVIVFILKIFGWVDSLAK